MTVTVRYEASALIKNAIVYVDSTSIIDITIFAGHDNIIYLQFSYGVKTNSSHIC